MNSKTTQITKFISGLIDGDYKSKLNNIDDPILTPIVDQLNLLAKTLASSTLGTSQAAQDTALVINALGIGIWKWDLVTNSLEWDENMYRLYGCNPKDFSGAYDA